MTKTNNDLLFEKLGELMHWQRRQMFGGVEEAHRRHFGSMNDVEETHGRHFGSMNGMEETHGRHFGSMSGGEEAQGEHFGAMRRSEGRAGFRRGQGGGRPPLETMDRGMNMHERHHGFGREGMADRRPSMARERLLRMIGEEEGISQKQLAHLFGIRPQSLSELLGKLEKDGYIARHQNENDKREILVYLTDQGRIRSEEVEKERSDRMEQMFSALTEEEKETLITLLNKLLPETDD